ncbi:flagellar basal body rod modification protein [Rubellimicrobium roseum]|uniref:Basal-body rod modification protein FlgD n=1 Tax=Rubellimicrobium roseum TaxID=687525 RepID=A0A5C4NLV9_9RHOB|nr:flagellar basal body rod modification protein [Rubellimicrobium roseum]
MTPTPAAATGATVPARSSTATTVPNDFNTFLKMLTVQMQNQDPLNPIDSSDYAVQLATFSGVEQQVKTNEILNGLSGQLALSGLSEMAGWVGRQARAAMPAWFDGVPVTISPKPLAAADRVELVVRDAKGGEVARSEIPVSSEPIEWAGVGEDGGPLPGGFYSFEVVSYAGGQPVLTEPAEIYARVTEVRTENGQPVLVMEGGGVVAADKVTALRAAG